MVRMLELARGDPDEPYTGSRSHFGERVRRMRREQQQQASADVPMRFEGLPGEYLQVDWGEVRSFPFTHQLARGATSCACWHSRWVDRRPRQRRCYAGSLAALLPLTGPVGDRRR